MNLKNIKNYKLNEYNNKILLIYRKFNKSRKFNTKIKSQLYNKFRATLVASEWYFKSLDKSKKNKIINSYRVYDIYRREKKIEKKNLLKIFKIFFIYIFKRLPILNINIYGPGYLEPSFLKRQLNLLNYNIFLNQIQKFKYINVRQNKKKFLNLLKKNQINKIETVNFLPPFFFSDQIKNLKNYKINFNAASDLIFNDNIAKLFISSKNFKFVNWAHGGSYFEYKNSYLESFEKNLAGKYPKIQKVFGKNLNFNSKNIELILALRSPVINSDKFTNPFLFEHLNDRENFNIFKSLIEKYKIKIRPHPRGFNKVYNKYKFKNITQRISNNSIILFDSLSSSLVNWCLAQNIPFIYIIKNLNYKNLQPRFVRYIKTSVRNDCLFFYKNKKKTEIFIEKILSNKININKIIKTNKKIFKDIKIV